MQAGKAKERQKIRRVERSLELLYICQQHGGPVTPQNIDLIQTLNETQIGNEVKYLRSTVAKELRIKEQVTDPTTKRFTYEKIPVEQLKISIPSTVKPLF